MFTYYTATCNHNTVNGKNPRSSLDNYNHQTLSPLLRLMLYTFIFMFGKRDQREQSTFIHRSEISDTPAAKKLYLHGSRTFTFVYCIVIMMPLSLVVFVRIMVYLLVCRLTSLTDMNII